MPQFAVEVWQGFVYVSLNPTPPPLADALTGLSAEIDDYRIAEYEPLLRSDEEWETNSGSYSAMR